MLEKQESSHRNVRFDKEIKKTVKTELREPVMCVRSGRGMGKKDNRNSDGGILSFRSCTVALKV